MNESELPASRYADWRQQVERELKGASFEKSLLRRSQDGVTWEPLYTANHPAKNQDPGYPGRWPFVRGGRVPGESGWLRIQYYSQGDRASVRREMLDDLEGGTHGVYLRIGAPESHDGGIEAQELSDFEELFSDIWIEAVPITIDAGAHSWSVGAQLLALFQKRGVKPHRLALTFDPLGELARTGCLPFSIEDARREFVALGREAQELDGVRALGISTVSYQEAGASVAQELGFYLATATEYLRWWSQAGHGVESFADQSLVTLSADRNILEEVAKLRAARLLWAKLSRTISGQPDGHCPWFHGITSRRSLARRDPWLNLMRVSCQAFAGIVGGVDSLSTRRFDEMLTEDEKQAQSPRISETLGSRMARNTQIILEEEGWLGAIADPAGGSYAIEALTEAYAREGWGVFQEIERQGGMTQALSAGWVQDQIRGAWSERLKSLSLRKEKIIGVNEYPAEGDAPLSSLSLQHRGVTPKTKASTGSDAPLDLDARGVMEELSRLCLQNDVSVDQLNGRLGRRGTLSAPKLPARRDCDVFESIWNAGAHSSLSVFLAKLNTISESSPRVGFARNFFGIAGLGVEEGPDRSDRAPEIDEIVEAYRASHHDIVCLCGLNDAYAERGQELVHALKKAGAKSVYLAGKIPEEDALVKSGLSGAIYLGCDVVEFLSTMLKAHGVDGGAS